MRGRVIRWVLPLALVASAGAGSAMAMTASTHAGASTVKAVTNAKYGTVLVSSNGRTLYRYTPDKKGVSTCTGACLKFWPPLLVKAGSKPTVGAGANAALLGTTKAAHGMAQVTYAGFPLYFFAQDKKAGQTSGQGVGAKWFVVDAKGALVMHAMTVSTSTTTSTKASSSGGGWG